MMEIVRINVLIAKHKMGPVICDEPEKLEGGNRVMGAEIDAAGLINQEVIPGYPVGLAVVVGVLVEPAGKKDEVTVSNTVGGGTIAKNAAAFDNEWRQRSVLGCFLAPLMEEMGRNHHYIHRGCILRGREDMGRKESGRLWMELAEPAKMFRMILGA